MKRYWGFSYDVTKIQTTETPVVHMLVKKVTYFKKFGYLNSLCIRKCIILMFLSSSRDKFTLL